MGRVREVLARREDRGDGKEQRKRTGTQHNHWLGNFYEKLEALFWLAFGFWRSHLNNLSLYARDTFVKDRIIEQAVPTFVNDKIIAQAVPSALKLHLYCHNRSVSIMTANAEMYTISQK